MWRSAVALAALTLPLMTWAAPECSPQQAERFVEFLPRFLSSKPFALQRTVLPLPLLHWQAGVDTEGRPITGPDKSYLSAREYFQWPTLNEYMQSRELLSRISDQRAGSAVLELYQDGSQAVVVFHFKPDAGCWKLWQYEVRPA